MEYKETAIKAVKEGGEVLRSGFENLGDIKDKGSHDIVSEFDVRSEQMILKTIKSQFPEHSILAEESGTDQNESDYTWYVDPLDGTSNFVMRNPYFSISIALALKNKVIMGVVYNPILNELFYAETGKGAFLNGTPIKVSKKSELKDAFVASAYLSEDKEIVEGLNVIKKLALNTRKTVIHFSPALNLCNIARGRIDALVDNGTMPEDHAAGSIILTEAGGMVQNYGSNEWDINKIGIVASNGLLQNKVIELIS